MMQKEESKFIDKYKVLLIILFLFLILFLLFLVINTIYSSKYLNACPEKWIVNEIGIEKTNVFIYQGKKVNTDRINKEWIYRNCSLTKEIIY